VSDLFDDDPRAEAPRSEQRGRSRALIITAAVLLGGFLALTAFSAFWTERLWFQSLGYTSVFTTLLWTRVGLFLVFGAVMALAVGANVLVAYRMRPLFRPATPEQTGLDRYRDVVVPVRAWLFAGVAILIGLFGGASASGQWRTFLMWRNSESFGTTDPYFDRDIGFYVFELPWFHFVVDFVMAVAIVALLASAAVHYLFGGIRLQVPHDRLSPAAQAQFSVLLGVFVLAKGADYWLDRFDLLNESGSLITGMTYADENAVLPARNILAGIAVICAVLFFLNVWRRTYLLSAMGLAMMVLSSILIGMIWPGVVQQFSVDPTEADKEAPYIGANIDATRAAYDIADVEVESYDSETVLSEDQQTALDLATASVPVVDPQLVRQAFEQTQQVRAYYSVADVLDVDRYNIDGKDRALVLGARELDQEGLDDADKNWSNLHTVYTHGNGVIAAFANQRPADDVAQGDELQWAEGQQPDQRDLTDLAPDGYETRIYYGERSPSYSIVGKSTNGPDVELDLPAGAITEGEEATTTYDGAGGIGVGSLFRKVLYAVKYGEPNIVLSERVNENSKILYDRRPGEMLKKVAPWLTVDSDPYPAVVDGRVMWILDGYTTTDQYPQSQRGSFEDMTEDSLATNTGFQTLPTDEVNYMRNAVKATVDAYDGTVTLYAWDEEDPILKAWRSIFPGVVKDRADIPETLLSHLRYPEDLFKVQRFQFARYHVTDAADFYEGNQRWQVPPDPITTSQLQPPYRLFVNPQPVVDDPATEEDESAAAEPAEQVFSLTSVYVPRGRQTLASYVSVDSDATDEENYGKIRVLELPNEATINGPRLAANQISSDDGVREELLRFSQGAIRTSYGNLLTLPVGNGLMYIQPLYASRDTESPLTLQFVMVAYGDSVGIGATLDAAILDVLGGVANNPTEPEPGGGGGTPPTGSLSAEAQRLLALASDAYEEADRLQAEGDTAGWAAALDEARGYIDDALALLGQGGDDAEPDATESPTPSPTPSG